MLPNPEFLRTENYSLRALTPAVYKQLFETCSDDEIKNYFGFSGHEDLENEREQYGLGLSTYKISFVYFHIMNKNEDQIIGDCGFHTWYLKHSRAEIGYGLRFEKDKGKGIMSEILPTLLHYGFDLMKLHRIEAMVGKNNQASMRLLEKNGFNIEGQLKEHYLNQNIFEDSLVYALLKNEWDLL